MTSMTPILLEMKGEPRIDTLQIRFDGWLSLVRRGHYVTTQVSSSKLLNSIPGTDQTIWFNFYSAWFLVVNWSFLQKLSFSGSVMWWLNQKIAAMRVANDRRKTAFRLPSQMDSMVSKASRKSTVIILAKPVFSEQLVLLGWLNGGPVKRFFFGRGIVSLLTM